MPRKLIWTALHRVMPARVEGSDVRATGGPWTLSGVPDSDLDDVERQNNHRLLTDPSLAAVKSFSPPATAIVSPIGRSPTTTR